MVGRVLKLVFVIESFQLFGVGSKFGCQNQHIGDIFIKKQPYEAYFACKTPKQTCFIIISNEGVA